MLSVSGALPKAANAAHMTASSTALWSTGTPMLVAMAGLSFAVGAAVLVVLRGLAPAEATRAILRRWGAVLSINIAGVLSVIGLIVPAAVVLAGATGLALDATKPEHEGPLTFAVGAIIFIPTVRTFLSVSTAFAAMVAEGLRLRPALRRSGELLKGNRVAAAGFFGSIVVVAAGFPTAAVLVTGVDPSSLAAMLVLSAIYIIAIAIEATALAVLYRALVGSQHGASSGRLAEVFE